VDDGLIHEACVTLRERFSVHHATLQIENGGADQPCHLADEAVV
jgi:hypothetical protein